MDFFSINRTIYGLEMQKEVPNFLRKLSCNYIPENALFISCLFILFGYAIASLSPTLIAAFTISTTIAATLFIF
ncbi:hypothetical protein [Bartonella fuyuanensis]|uniref:hypothetical protein n=1 Tax=Bartonella fuyuanensis TaxID=1460968 RepID=UPI0031B61453